MTIDESDSSVIVIPHDIDTPVIVVVDGIISTEKFNGSRLRQVIHDAERIRLDGVFDRTTKRLQQQGDLPEEKEGK